MIEQIIWRINYYMASFTWLIYLSYDIYLYAYQFCLQWHAYNYDTLAIHEWSNGALKMSIQP